MIYKYTKKLYYQYFNKCLRFGTLIICRKIWLSTMCIFINTTNIELKFSFFLFSLYLKSLKKNFNQKTILSLKLEKNDSFILFF